MSTTDDVIERTSPEPLPSTPAELLEWCRTHRADNPVHYDERQRSWQVFRYVDVAEVLGDPARYLADLGDLRPSNPELDLMQRGNFVNMDGPRHRMLRGLVSQAFTSKVVTALTPKITTLTGELLDAVADRESFDLVDALAYPLPVTVVSELLGVPAEDRPLFRRWAEQLFPFNEEDSNVAGTQDAMDALIPAVREMIEYFRAQLDRRRARPADDLTTRLVEAETAADKLTDDDIIGVITLLLTAGHVTTTALLGNAVLTLHEHPEAAARLRTDRDALPSAVDEVLRYRPSLPWLTRRTATEVTLAGQVIPAGDVIMPWLVSANRDEAKFRDPDVFDIGRRPNQYLSFGHGIHYCLGAPLAKLETRIALGLLFDRYREIAVVDDEFHHPFAMGGAKSLSVAVVR
ncbi:cytochrome P450 [Saccharothrix ecbatanensis]|uniref:Cytochrome P450 n=1 Tax=Saccharothrix ecbatanensis TaxID=1105145 RepID=A0A7W9HHE7_9PSEU|nr:cytochrome P450 [Saccharothrix ecbatanensis]MBB5802205.1 cytochrome P450 [Saccharothrix ecbatanensis]